ncbi:MAG: M14 family zinc carboxypeptidase [Vicinamibacterales bacterium]
MKRTTVSRRLPAVVVLAIALGASSLSAGQAGRAASQRLDEAYTKKILDETPDPRMEIDLVNHMPLPADSNVPSPLKVLGYIPGENGNLTYSKDVYAYLDALAKASPRVTCWSIGQTEEGRDTRACAVADEATIRDLDKFKQMSAQLTDPRKLTDAQARTLIQTAKPIYWATGSIHSGETGSVEMLMELGYRLAIEETPFIQQIRNNVIFVFTPTTEVDGHDRQVDNQRAARAGQPQPSMVYWGKYVQHDNNRDGIGKGLKLSQNVLAAFLDMHPQVLHDLHESVNLLYTSTGTGPYNPIVDPIQVGEWWQLAQNDIVELTKKGVPGVWTYNYYDGWVPNYMFWIGVSHNAIGRFYETQSGGNTGANGDNISTPGAQSREWYRPNPNPGDVQWNMRSNVNMQQSGVLTSLNYVARNRETFLENYYKKMQNQVNLGKTQAPYAYVIPKDQRKRADVTELVNLIRREGAEVSVASSAFKVGDTQVNAGDYVARMDQPYRGIIEMYLGLQWYPAENPRPYDDTGWSIPLLHNITVNRVDESSILDQPMTVLAADAKFAGSITGTGSTIVIDHTTDNTLATFRWKNASVKMSAAEAPFQMGGHSFAAGAVIIANANRAALEPQIADLGLQAWATDTAPSVAMHDLDVPRIGYIHSWQSTQDEGWVRMGLDMYGIPYTYFGDNEVRKGNLRQRFDVILYPSAGVQVDGAGPPQGGAPQPYRATDLTPSIATAPDQTDDRRGGLGRDGLRELQQFVWQGGVLITEGQSTAAFVENGFAPGISVADTSGLAVPGSVIKTLLGDKTSPILYGYDQNALAVLIKNGPVLAMGGGGGGRGGRGGRGGGDLPPGVGGGNLQPMSEPAQLTTLAGGAAPAPPGTIDAAGRGGRGGGRGGFGGGGRGGGGRGGFGGRGGGGAGAAPAVDPSTPRVILSYPDDPNDLLLSGMLVGGDNLAGNVVLVDSPFGQGHVVLFANRPFWRNEPHGNYFLWFNAMLNWNDLGAGR